MSGARAKGGPRHWRFVFRNGLKEQAFAANQVRLGENGPDVAYEDDVLNPVFALLIAASLAGGGLELPRAKLDGARSPADAALTDAGVHVPPGYNTFVPPAMGQTYVDPVFGALIKRASAAPTMVNNAVGGSLLFVSTEYSTASPFNSNNRSLILQHGGYFGLYDGGGTYLRDLPFAVNASTEPRWSRADPNALYYVSGNKLMKLTVSTGASTIIRAFTEYTAIRGRGESDISRDGDHFVFSADPPSGVANRHVFVYEISTNTKGKVLDTIGHSFNQLYLASNNSVAIGWIADGSARFTGIELFDRNMTFERQLTHASGHMHLTQETNGDDVLIWTNSNDAQPIQNCRNGIVKVRLANAQQTCLLELDWSLAVHITAGDGDWAFVETYDPADPPATSPPWKPFTNEILQVKLDGTETRRLLHHRSRQTGNYGYQPRASVSRDGSTLVFTSNYNLQAISGYANGYTDAYLVAVPGSSTPQLQVADAEIAEGNDTAANLVFTVTLSHVSDVPVTVQFQTMNGTAVAPGDYTAAGPTTLTFPPMTLTQTLSIAVQGERVIEPDETFQVILSNPANAQITRGTAQGTILNDDATRVFVADSGDDANRCALKETPCRSLAGGSSQVVTDGEVIVLTSGEYESAPLVITRGVRISAPSGVVAFVRQPITVNAPGGRVTLRGLTLKSGGAFNAVTLTAADTLSIEEVTIDGWSIGLRLNNAAAAHVSVSNSIFRANTKGVNDSGGAAGNRISIEEARFEGNVKGLEAVSGAFMVRESAFVSNSGSGVVAGPGSVDIQRSDFSFNGTGVNGLSGGTVRISRSRVFANTTGLAAVAGATLISTGKNVVRGNTNNVSGMITTVPEQ